MTKNNNNGKGHVSADSDTLKGFSKTGNILVRFQVDKTAG